MTSLLAAGDYEAVLHYATTMCQKHANSATGNYWRASALLWLERYDEVLEVTSRLERLQADGVLNLSDPWLVAFAEFNCGALSGLKQYRALREFSSRCLERHPGSVSLAAYQLLATMHLGTLTAQTQCLHLLDGALDRFDEPWHFYVLYAAQRDLGNRERASEIARLALARFPDDEAVRDMAKSKHTSRRTCDVRQCRPKCGVRTRE